MSSEPSEFEILRKERRSEYETWTPMYCPALGKAVIFNSKGFKHLRFNPDGTPRNPKEAIYKLELLPLVRSVIRLATKIEEYRKQKEMEYWAITEVVGKQKTKVRVILRKVGNGRIHFWSVMRLS